jgi:Lipase C-terminal domain
LDLRIARRQTAVLALTLFALLALASPPPSHAQQSSGDHNAVIFIHGYSGSGAQFESQKLRFVENGYPQSYVRVLDYNSAPATPVPGATGLNPAGIQVIEQQLFPRLDQLVADLKAETGRSQVDLTAHSLGTTLMHDYLNSSPTRAANVAHYVNLDGRTATTPPGGVSTLALWGSKGPLSPPNRSITGATNVTIPDSTHVQVATSPVSFGEMYKFFNGGQAPATTDVVPEKGKITLAGKALSFPDNDGMPGAVVQVWPIDDATGQRTSTTPLASYTTDGSGDWGPVAVQAGRRYEFALIRQGAPVHHFYYEPFLRSDDLLRLLESDVLRTAAGGPSPNSVGLVAIRYKELWGDQGAENDALTLNGIDVCNAVICPLSGLVNALFAYDRGQDGKTDTSQKDPVYSRITFVSGVDVFMPAQSPPVGKVTLTLRSRGGGPTRTITFPNFPSSTDVNTIQLNDFDQVAPARAAPRATCVRRNRFTFRIHQPKHGRIVRADAYINGHRVKRVRGHRVKRLTLRRPRGKNNFRVLIVARWADGHRTVSVRRFRRCGKTHPVTHVHGPRHHSAG